MKFNEIFTEEKIGQIPDKKAIGIDIGSRQSKAVLLAEGEIYTAIIPTGYFMKENAKELLQSLFKQSGLARKDIDYIVGTGYGRIALEFKEVPSRIVTEISCHGLGAHYLGRDIHTIIDIGGQDSKVIRIDPANGKVTDFVMNDKCAAGTGRFLEKTANILGYDVTKIGEISLQAEKASDISSQCVVFAESEIISGRAKGEKASNLAAGIHLSVAKRINNLLNRVGIEPNVLFTGGLSNNAGMKKALEDILGFPVETSKLNTVFAGALGAALYACQYATEEVERRHREESGFSLELTDLENALEQKKEDYIKKSTGKKKNVAYLCTYTPVEILNAADVSHIRLLHVGNQKEIASGETITQSIFCDFTKSCLGGFNEKNPLYSGIDKVYTFYTCDCMRKTAEAINDHFVPASIFNLPRLIKEKGSKQYFVSELAGFQADLEKLTKQKISGSDIRRNIELYNKAKRYIREISAYRKHRNPLLTSGEFQRIALSYYYLPAKELLFQLEKILKQLKAARPEEGGRKPIRLMVAGGIIADGDHKVTDIIEKEIGARIVIEDNCTGYSPFAKDIGQNSGDVLEDIADGYLGQAPCARMKPLSERIDFSAELAREYEVDGVIFYYMKFCPCYGIAKNEFVHRFQEMNVPVLEIPADYSSGDEGQIKTRIEAFIEVLGERG
jgi:predicted CoA-substrate-specific enzyme activase